METYKIKIILPERKRPQYKTVIATSIEIAATMIISYVYNELCNDERSHKIPEFFHVVEPVSESKKGVELHLFISRMDLGKEMNIRIHLKRITSKKQIIDGVILSERMFRCNGFWKDEAPNINI